MGRWIQPSVRARSVCSPAAGHSVPPSCCTARASSAQTSASRTSSEVHARLLLVRRDRERRAELVEQAGEQHLAPRDGLVGAALVGVLRRAGPQVRQPPAQRGVGVGLRDAAGAVARQFRRVEDPRQVAEDDGAPHRAVGDPVGGDRQRQLAPLGVHEEVGGAALEALALAVDLGRPGVEPVVRCEGVDERRRPAERCVDRGLDRVAARAPPVADALDRPRQQSVVQRRVVPVAAGERTHVGRAVVVPGDHAQGGVRGLGGEIDAERGVHARSRDPDTAALRGTRSGARACPLVGALGAA